MPRSDCPKGQIKREGYTATRKKTGTTYKVPPTCIKDRGLPGKGKDIIPAPKEGKLSKFGYSDIKKKSAATRHQAIGKAVKEINPTTVVRDLHALATLTRNTDPRFSSRVKADARWASKTYLGRS